MLADTEDDLQRLMEKITTGVSLGLKINKFKKKVIVISRKHNAKVNIEVNGRTIEQVKKFKYLGCWITENLDPDLEIRTRIEMARSVFLRLRNFLSDQGLSLESRFRFVKCYIYSVLLYGMETWTINLEIMNRLEAFEM